MRPLKKQKKAAALFSPRLHLLPFHFDKLWPAAGETGSGMFQPMCSPFHSHYGVVHVASANTPPDYTFEPAPLGQDGSGGGGSSVDSGGLIGGLSGLSPEAANIVYSSPIFHGLPSSNTNNHAQAHAHAHATHLQLARDHHSQQHHQLHIHPGYRRQSRRVKMEQQSDLALQEAAARDYKPALEVSTSPSSSDRRCCSSFPCDASQL